MAWDANVAVASRMTSPITGGSFAILSFRPIISEIHIYLGKRAACTISCTSLSVHLFRNERLKSLLSAA